MSSQKGNTQRQRSQKYKNSNTFKNTLHDTSKQTKMINQLEMVGLCSRCKEIIEWKIKYKKYKPLTQPKKCTKCEEKRVNRAYYTICPPCIEKHDVCGKCNLPNGNVIPISQKTQAEINQEFEANLKLLKERERRTLLRLAKAALKEGEGEEEDENAQAERSRAVKQKYLKSKGVLDLESDDNSDGDLDGSDLDCETDDDDEDSKDNKP